MHHQVDRRRFVIARRTKGSSILLVRLFYRIVKDSVHLTWFSKVKVDSLFSNYRIQSNLREQSDTRAPEALLFTLRSAAAPSTS